MHIKVKDIDRIVFVATLPRSGSSLDCGILEACGAFGGRTRGPVKNNPKGIFENPDISRIGFSPIFRALGNPSPVEALKMVRKGTLPASLFSNVVEDFHYIMTRHGYESGTAYYKGGAFIFLFEELSRRFPDASWILPTRNRANVLRSWARTYPAIPEDVAKARIAAYVAMYSRVLSSGHPLVCAIDNDAVMSGDFSSAKSAVEKVGLEWNDPAVKEWIDQTLWNNFGSSAQGGNMKLFAGIKKDKRGNCS